MAQGRASNHDEHARHKGGVSSGLGGGIAERLVELEAEVGELERMLERSHRLVTLGTIVASIAHELNNILTPVMSYAELAQQHPDDPGLRGRALSRIASGVSRASEITSAILAFAGAGGAEGGGTASDVGEAVESAMRCMARDPAADGIDVRVDVPRGLTAGIDATALSHIVLNLILNARRAMRKGGGCLAIRAWRGTDWRETPTGMEGGGRKESPRPPDPTGRTPERHQADRQQYEEQSSTPRNTEEQVSDMQVSGRGSVKQGMSDACAGRAWVVVEVRDTGCGMGAEVLAGLFRPFASSREDKGGEIEGGTGLGLAICARLVSAVGGRIVVWSKAGGGTVFRVVIPAG